MSKKPLKALLVLVQTLLLIAVVGEAEELANVKIGNQTGDYTVVVTKRGEETVVDIFSESSGKRTLAAHWSAGNMFFQYVRPIYPSMDRFVLLLGDGNAIVTVIFSLTPLSERPLIVFNKSSQFEPDFIDTRSGEVILFYLERGITTRLPEKVALYLWNSHRYNLVKSVSYKQRFSALRGLDRSPSGTNAAVHSVQRR